MKRISWKTYAPFSPPSSAGVAFGSGSSVVTVVLPSGLDGSAGRSSVLDSAAGVSGVPAGSWDSATSVVAGAASGSAALCASTAEVVTAASVPVATFAFCFCASSKAVLNRPASVMLIQKCSAIRRNESVMMGTGDPVHALSELANLMARVSAVGAPSETSAATFHTQLLSEPIFGWSFMSVVTVTRIRENHATANASHNEIGRSAG